MQSLCVIAQVESPLALSAIPSIGQVEGLDGIFVGPNDLAANMGRYGQPRHAEVQAAIRVPWQMIKATGKLRESSILIPIRLKNISRQGFDFVAVASDASMLSRRSDELLAKFAPSLPLADE